MKLVLVGVLVSATACGGSRSYDPMRYAVGARLGGGNIFGSSTCTYDGPPSVIQLDPDKQGGTLVGEGTVNATCESGAKLTYVVKRPTAMKITGSIQLPVGSDGYYEATLMAGAEELVGNDGKLPDWKLGPDCAASVEEIPDTSAQDTGGKSGQLHLRGKAKGTCQLDASSSGFSSSRSLSVP